MFKKLRRGTGMVFLLFYFVVCELIFNFAIIEIGNRMVAENKYY